MQITVLKVFLTSNIGNAKIFSNQLYEELRDSHETLNLIGPLKMNVVSLISAFLDYKFLMTTLRYLNKSFIALTQDIWHHSFNRVREASIKVSLSEAYEGKSPLPLVMHPFYTNCTKLRLIYQICKGKDHLWADPSIEGKFLKELFEYHTLFPHLNQLKIFVSHSLR